MGKKADRASVTTWFTLVMLNLPAACLLSLPWDLQIIFRMLSNFSLTSFHFAEQWNLRSGSAAEPVHCKKQPASFCITVPLELSHRANPSPPMDLSNLFSLFRQEFYAKTQRHCSNPVHNPGLSDIFLTSIIWCVTFRLPTMRSP